MISVPDRRDLERLLGVLFDSVEYLLAQTHASLLREREAARNAGNDRLYERLHGEWAQAEVHRWQIRSPREPPPSTPT